MSIKSKTLKKIAVSGALCGAIIAGSIAAPTFSQAVSSKLLLDKVSKTVLGQNIAYPDTSTAQLTSSIITLQPGEETGWHRHDAPIYGYIISGKLEVSYEGKSAKTYRAGTAFMDAIGSYHNGKNVGVVPLRILVVNVGAEGVQNTVKKLP